MVREVGDYRNTCDTYVIIVGNSLKYTTVDYILVHSVSSGEFLSI